MAKPTQLANDEASNSSRLKCPQAITLIEGLVKRKSCEII